MSNEKKPGDTLLTFPCDFTIKVFGAASEEFEAAILAIIRKQVPTVTEKAIKSRSSENGKYIALSITVHVDSKQQLDNVYLDLTASPLVLMAL